MRKPMPLRWIEEAEARQVLAIALFELPLPGAPTLTHSLWRERARSWGAAAAPNPPVAPLSGRPQLVDQCCDVGEPMEVVN